MALWTLKSTISDVEVQFIDTPGLGDSNLERTDEQTKEEISTFLAQHKPDCVMLFFKFFTDLTAVSFFFWQGGRAVLVFENTKPFKQAVLFVKEIATKYKCSVLFLHTFCDTATNIDNYPVTFVDDIIDSSKDIQKAIDDDQRNGEKLLTKETFTSWRQAREMDTKKILGEDITFLSCCYGRPRFRGITKQDLVLLLYVSFSLLV